MRKVLLALSLIMFFVGPILAQSPNEMKKLSWMIGDWEGEGSIVLGPDKRNVVQQKENVQGKLDDNVLIIEGIGKEKERIVHHAFAVVSFDRYAKRYLLRAIKADGDSVDAETRMTDEAFEWGFQSPQTGKVKYTIKHTDADEWHETGEYSRDEGKTWIKFFEMKLRRIKKN